LFEGFGNPLPLALRATAFLGADFLAADFLAPLAALLADFFAAGRALAFAVFFCFFLAICDPPTLSVMPAQAGIP
jgi:hypothetical protein